MKITYVFENKVYFCKKNYMSSSNEYNNIHLAVMAIESAAREMNVSGQEVYARLKALGLIHNFLLKYYEELHTQSVQWLADATVETLRNWEAVK